MFSQQLPVSKNTKISVLTVGVADESHSLYGHTALRLKDTSIGYDLVYNFGIFDFRTPNFMLKFIKGDLQYFAAAYSFTDFEAAYHQENRSIYEQVLNLSLAQKTKIAANLYYKLAPENNLYTYKFIDRNCTTKVIDVLHESLGAICITKNNSKNETYRTVLFPYSSTHFWEQLGINCIFGKRVDEAATTLFLPFDLLDALKESKYQNQKLVNATTTLFKAERTPYFSFFDTIYFFCLLLVAIILIRKKALVLTYFAMLGLLGIFFIGVGFYSFHQEVLWNYNVLLFNPLYLFLIYFLIKKQAKRIKITSDLIRISLLIYLVFVLSKAHIWLVLPIIVTNFILLFRLKKQNLRTQTN